MPSHDKRTLQVLQETYDELQRYYTLLRMIRVDLEKIAKNFATINGGYRQVMLGYPTDLTRELGCF